MIKVEHKLRFVTEFDENHPVAKEFLRLDEISQIYMLESMLKDLLAPALKPVLDEINARGTYAILKVAE
jgi:NurA-like 5'-3' nuclease